MIAYHRIGGPLELGVTRVARRVFERQMRSLARAGWRTLGLADLAATFRSPTPVAAAPRTVVLTFDDGDAGLADLAYPVLAELGFRATTFLITDYVGRSNTWDARYTWRRLRHLDWAAVETWQARGFEFGSHTATHPRLTWLGADRIAEELARSRAALVGRLGPDAGRAVAYPFGAVDRRVERLARAAGYEVGFGGVRSAGRGPLRVPRVPVYVWDAFSTPTGLRGGGLGLAGRLAAHVANRCAVGTSLMLRVMGRRGPALF